MEIKITVTALDCEKALDILGLLQNLEKVPAGACTPPTLQDQATQQQLADMAAFTQQQRIEAGYAQQPAYPQQPPQGFTVPQDHAHTMAQQPAYLQQPPQQPGYPTNAQQWPVQQQPAYVHPQQQPAYVQPQQQPPQQPAPTAGLDYTHEQLGRAVAPFIDKAPANRQAVQNVLKGLGVDSVTQLTTPQARAAYAVGLRQIGVQI